MEHLTTPTCPTPEPRHRPRRLWRILAWLTAAVLVLLLLLGAGSYWLLMTNSGAQQAAQWLSSTSRGDLQLHGVRGRLLGPLQIQRLSLRLEAGTAPLQLHQLSLAWQPGELLQQRLHITQLAIERLQLPGPSSSPLELPQDLRLPLSMQIDRLSIAHLDTQETDGPTLPGELKATLLSDGQHHRLTLAEARWQGHRLSATAELDGQAPFAVTAQAQLLTQAMQQADGRLPALAVAGQLEGTLKSLKLYVQGSPHKPGPLAATPQPATPQPAASQAPASDDFHLAGTLLLTPFDAQQLRHIQLSARHLNPRRFHEALPEADLSLDADLKPDTATRLHGSLKLNNRQPAPINQAGLPISQLTSQLAMDFSSPAPTEHRVPAAVAPAAAAPAAAAADYRIEFSHLDIAAHHGRIQGELSLRLPGGQATAAQAQGKLQFQAFDPALWHSKLRPMRLQGQLAFDGNQQQQQAQLQLADGQRQLKARLQLDAQTLKLEALELRQGQALLNVHGEVQRVLPHAWQLAGQLSHIDPAQFAQLPQADLNARFTTTGQWRGRSAGRLELLLEHSQLAGQALSLDAQLAFIGLEQPEHLLSADGQVQLSGKLRFEMAGSRVSLQGGWGRASDTLDVQLDLPDLSRHRQFLQQIPRWAALPKGLAALDQLAGRVLIDASLSGFPRRPQIRLNTQAQHLVLPSGLRLEELHTQGALADASLDFELQASGFYPRASSSDAIDSLQLKFSGERERHQLQLAASYRKQHLQLAASGGLVEAQDWRDTGWRGTLTRLALTLGEQPPALLALMRELQLEAPAPLQLDRHAFDLGAARLRIAGGTLELQTSHWSAAGWHSTGRFSNVHLQADQPTAARAAGHWSLSGKARDELQGKLQARIPDLRGVAAAFNPRLTSAGALDIDLALAGTPSSPELQGSLRGNHLALGFPEHNLQLMDGRLELQLTGNQARLKQLSFRAPYQARPRSLRASGYSPAQTHGELNIQGDFDLERQSATLSARLDHLPLMQHQQRWLVVSGQGKLVQAGLQSTLQATLSADAGYLSGMLLNQPQLADDIVILGQETRAPGRLRLDSDIKLDLGEHFHLNAAGLSARLAGQLHLRGSPLRASGSILTQDASYSAYGQRLTVERGIVNFQGPLENPGLNVLALRKGEAVEAGVSITGTVKRPHIQLVSTPEVPDSEKLSWIVLGRLPDSAGNDAGLLLSAAGSILGSGGEDLATRIADSFGLDEFALRKGRGGDTLDNQILSLGKRLSARAYLNYEQGLSAAHGTLKLSYTLGRSLTLVTRAGIDAAVDVFYTLKLD